jgi:hypothetical protein
MAGALLGDERRVLLLVAGHGRRPTETFEGLHVGKPS